MHLPRFSGYNVVRGGLKCKGLGFYLFRRRYFCKFFISLCLDSTAPDVRSRSVDGKARPCVNNAC